MVDIKIPKWGLTMEEATIVEWQIKIGDRVTKGDVIAIIETDKAEGELEAPSDGVIGEILFEDGDEAEVEAIVGRLYSDEEWKHKNG